MIKVETSKPKVQSPCDNFKASVPCYYVTLRVLSVRVCGIKSKGKVGKLFYKIVRKFNILRSKTQNHRGNVSFEALVYKQYHNYQKKIHLSKVVTHPFQL